MRSHDLPLKRPRWQGANLSRNPFGELTRSERAALAVVEIEAVLKFIRSPPQPPAASDGASPDSHSHTMRPKDVRPNCAYQIIGDCGRGKTTRLLAIEARVENACYVYLPEDGPCPSIPDSSLLLIDEAQRLPRAIRRQVFQSGRALVLATHSDLSRPLRMYGYDVHSERIGLKLSPERLAEILNRRIRASRRDDELPTPSVTTSTAEKLIRRFGTNVRAIEGYLYDIVQSQVDDHGKMRFID